MVRKSSAIQAAQVAGATGTVGRDETMTARLLLQGITKRYAGVVANDDIALEVAPGEIHAVLGENGAGKSTLMKIIYGAVHPDAGLMHWNGRSVVVRSPQQARALGIAMVFQHFSLFDTLSAAENVWLGLARTITLEAVAERMRSVGSEYGLTVDPLRPVHTLSVGERQRVEILRALLSHPQLLILDEPTSVLTPAAVQKLFGTLRRLADSGCSILYISHKLDEIRALCQRCTVLRGGRVSGIVNAAEESNASLSRLMIGVEPSQLLRKAPVLGQVALKIDGLQLAKRDRFGVALVDLALAVNAGEIVGLAGVSGNGQAELMAALSGEDVRAPAGSIRLFGHDVALASPRERRRFGLHCIPEERLGRGAVPSLSLTQNTLLTRTSSVAWLGWLRLTRARALAERLIERFRVKARGVEAPAKSLSGGNLQKFIVGRELDALPRVLLVSQPTWGVDVGAAAEIRAELLRLRDSGSAVLVVSEELEELFEICDRIAVLARGRLSPAVPTSQASIEQIGEWMSGLWPNADATSRAHESNHAQA
jgi:simple sugar transport system ATP-binding protein